MVMHKILDILKAALIEEKQMEIVLSASATALCFDLDDAYENRDCELIYT